MKSEVIGKRVRRLLEEKQTETSVIAKKLKISTRTLEDKLEGKKEFFLNEVIDIIQIFELDVNTVGNIFFKEENKRIRMRRKDIDQFC